MFASEYPLAQSAISYLRSEVAEVLAIYRTLWPRRRLRLVLREGEDAVVGTAVAKPIGAVIEPRDLADGFLGCVEQEPAAEPGREEPETMILIVTVPRLPTTAERRQTEPDWAPRWRGLRLLHTLAPLRYEQMRYVNELRQERLSRAHLWTALPRQTGSPVLRDPSAGGLRLVPPGEERRAAFAAPAILIAMHWLEVGGAEKLAFDSMRWAQAAGLRVFVVAGKPSLHRLRDRLPPGATFLRLDRYLPHRDWAPFLERFIRQENVRIVHIHHCAPIYAALAHLRVMVPWVRVIDSTHVVEHADGGYPRISGVWSNFIDTHHVISRQLADIYVQRFAVPLGRLRLGRMLARRGDADAAPSLPGANLRAGSATLEVSFVGRLFYQKRPVLAVTMMKALARWAGRNDVRLQVNMVGDGPYAAACDRLIRRYRLQGIVHRFPADADVPALLAKSDLLLLPSSNEGLALVCYEAIEHGAIPISSAVGAQAEIVPTELLLPREPVRATRRLIAVVDRLWRDQSFIDQQIEALHGAYAKIASDPTAEEVLMPLYRVAAAVPTSACNGTKDAREEDAD